MKQEERLRTILRELENTGEVRVTDLSRLLQCSEVTIRGDIKRLDEEGRLKRTYGGAIRRSAGISVSFRPGLYYERAAQKRAIAQKAYTYIEDRDTIMLGDSTTCLYLAECIQKGPEKQVSVITNSLCAAAMLVSCDHVTLFVLGGKVFSESPNMLDGITAAQVRRYHVNKAFIGINGINLKVGLTAAGAPQLEVKREMLACADRTFVLADSSKFGSKDLFMVCSVDEIYSIITDNEIEESYVKEAEKMNVRVVIA
ncbi:DeoR/GlpR family DNA-binding transcription regulator [Dysosmobacter sp.]|uniref:DeoR/GlpR family DNA-binding transcription regulator n=1 Tax=Dysosmobacter sp. TaxID=2591382 RepID=UPI001BB47E64|nr:DeoR/GlpR family DNA-binding transcription regulator [Dysosmobacter sp.]MCI6055468.1 DeoR/GlpR family DNA-binding transcription regulator [Dysosmobacter sp.]MDY5509067.1 DeoR/GlpR family DNA-binding transcription regulator [Dysosmobacter sp.]QUO37303.1 DeoR/GlpR transcriptional regulator [Dysosmobacter sp. Marseille-Q4140]